MSSAFGVIKSFQTYRVTDMTHSSARANGDEQNSRLYARALYEYTTRVASPLAPEASASRTRELGATMVARLS